MLKSKVFIAGLASWISMIAVLLAVGGCGSSAPIRAPTPARGSVVQRPTSNQSRPLRRVTARHARSSGARPLRFGTRLASSTLGARVFADSRHGFALATTVALGGQTYPADTTDGGRSWRVDGPIFHIPAAQGALGVGEPGVAGAHAYFAWGGAGNTVIDMTVDSGHHWWQAFMPGAVLSVIASQVSEQIGAPDGQSATALIEGPTSDPRGRGASIWAYTTHDGRHWRYAYSLNAVS